MPSSALRSPTSRGRLVLAIAALAVITVALSMLAAVRVGTLLAGGPAVDVVPIAPHQSRAEHALETAPVGSEAAAVASYLAAQSTAYWLTPERDPIGVVGATVSALTSQAGKEDRAAAIVVYGLPDRDCGNFSTGGLDSQHYPKWIDEIALAVKAAPQVQKMVVLEPDSIALASQCGEIPSRADLLSYAVDALTSARTWVYIDGGNSAWHSPDEMAALIRQMGIIGRVRGFASNVSNYQSSAAEVTYVRALAERLGNSHAVIDTSRNGRASAGSEWCNTRGQTVGAPSGAFHDDVVDMNLWIKPPGESDGPCNGGPPPGQWWPEMAAELTREVR